jgi:hypothetical protein
MKKTLLVLASVMLVSGLCLAADSFKEIRINCGADSNFKDSNGKEWVADKNFRTGSWGAIGGDTVEREPSKIEGAKDAKIYLTERYGVDSYKIPVENGDYKITLHFAETFDGIDKAGGRVFNVSINNNEVLKDFDVFKEAGNKRLKAVVKEFDVKAEKGEIIIKFTEKEQSPLINGIEIVKK